MERRYARAVVLAALALAGSALDTLAGALDPARRRRD